MFIGSCRLLVAAEKLHVVAPQEHRFNGPLSFHAEAWPLRSIFGVGMSLVKLADADVPQARRLSGNPDVTAAR